MAPLKSELEYFKYTHPVVTSTCTKLLYVITFPLCCSFCFFCCRFPGVKRRRGGCVRRPGLSQRETEKRGFMTDIHYQHKEQRLKRRQSLSIASSTDTSSWIKKLRGKTTSNQASNQASSPLFAKLPVEVRERIYEYVLLGSGAVQWYFPQAYTAMRKPLSLTTMPCLATDGGLENIHSQTSREETGASGCSLLRTCRLIYTEALPILYCNMQFAFETAGSLRAFSCITSTSKLEMIRSARIDIACSYSNRPWDSNGLDIFSSWKNLRKLYVVIRVDAYLSGTALPNHIIERELEVLPRQYDLYYVVFHHHHHDQDDRYIPNQRDRYLHPTSIAYSNYIKATSG
ncbi:hypothetical protein DM02DRAFT_270296 [Periconia macrospinosa]|uniref:DUF7730 domain-containing protein n=1 Tax=Periconia macrospinosa TaxID=97972 RepID=A0A2V1D3L6_9PLEO|nr:hypothetical protein DM02DRAFT_270296 [Periconia macrospinosa]